MGMRNFFETYPRIKLYILPITIGIVGFSLLILGICASFIPHDQKIVTFQDVQSVQSSKKPLQYTPAAMKTIVIDIEGAVIKPGTYHLTENSRVQDALTAAGGVSANADKDFVEKKVNLAAKLTDGQKIYIPRQGDTTAVSAVDQTQLSTDQTTLININDATADQLDALKGVGPVTAQKIIEGRPYAAVQDLLDKKIVSSKVFAEIKDMVSVY